MTLDGCVWEGFLSIKHKAQIIEENLHHFGIREQNFRHKFHSIYWPISLFIHSTRERAKKKKERKIVLKILPLNT